VLGVGQGSGSDSGPRRLQVAINTTSQIAELRRSREAAIRELRLAFQGYGLDVSAYGDHEVSKAIIAEATADICSSWNLFVRAARRLQHSHGGAAA
jgi:hypothetical protein